MKIFKLKPLVKFTPIILLVLFLSIYIVFSYKQQIAQNIQYGQVDVLPTFLTKAEDTEIEAFEKKQGFPVHINIPSIGVDANIQHVGFNSQGEMDVPDNTDILGWFAFGPRPGENGSAVIAGHYYGEDGVPGVFANLSKVKQGDKIYVKDSKGNTLSFVVRMQNLYDPGFVLEIFNRTDYPYLNLITCDGIWDTSKESYTKRLVVFADITN